MWIISYWILPLIAAGMWAATLMTMLIRWAMDGYPRYPSMESPQTIAYISDIGAQGLKPLFIAGAAVTGVVFSLSFASERWLRHRGRLLRNKGRIDKILAVLATLFAFLGAAGLVLLAVFDTLRYHRMHNGFLVLFMGGFLLSAIFVCLEYLRLGIHYRDHRILAISFCVKLLFIVIELGLSVAFGLSMRDRRRNRAAVLEWTIAFIFTFYVLSFAIDLTPAIRTRKHGKIPPMAQTNGMGAHRPISSGGGSSVPAYRGSRDVTYEEPLTTDSAGPAANTYRGYAVQNRV